MGSLGCMVLDQGLLRVKAVKHTSKMALSRETLVCQGQLFLHVRGLMTNGHKRAVIGGRAVSRHKESNTRQTDGLRLTQETNPKPKQSTIEILAQEINMPVY